MPPHGTLDNQPSGSIPSRLQLQDRLCHMNPIESITLESVCAYSDDVVSREIEELLIVIASGMVTSRDELYTLNDTGRAIWQRLDGRRTLAEIAGDIAGSSMARLRRSG